MIELDEKDLRDLQDVDGIVLQDVHGQRVAIGEGFDYENVFEFISDYFEEYGAEDFAEQIGYEDADEMFKTWFSGVPFNKINLMDWVCESFDGIDADLFADQLQDTYDYEEEARLEAEDHKLDQARGK